MPVTVPMSTSDLPAFDDYAMTGRTYRFAEREPLYPFGFGLGYAQISYGALSASTDKLSVEGIVTLRTEVTNGSDVDALETVQCYIEPPRSWPQAPRATLVDFKKVSVPARSTVSVEFKLPASAFVQFDSNGCNVHVPGTYGLVVGPASPGDRATALGAPAPARVGIEVV